MSRIGPGPRAAEVLAAVSIAMTIAGAALMTVNGQPIIGTFNLAEVVVGTVYAVVGAFLISRVPDNRMGWLFLGTALLWSLDLLLGQVARYGAVTAPGSVPNAALAAWAAQWIWTPGTAMLMFGVPLLFPDGRLPSPRWRPVAALGVSAVAIGVLGHMLAAWPLRDNVVLLLATFDASTAPGIAGVLAGIGDLATFILLPCVALPALVVRYRGARGVARQQMRWFTLAIVGFFVLVLGDILVGQLARDALGLLGAAGMAWLPIALAIAILRYRLYEVDRIISRTIGWALVTGILVATFAIVVVGLQTILAPVVKENTLAVAVSTLIVFALFQPLRRRVQRTVDRRFDRARYDGERTANQFADRLRYETNLAAARGDLVATATHALQPRAATIWLRGER